MKNRVLVFLIVVLMGCATNEPEGVVSSSPLEVILPSMVMIPGGDFLMGSPESEVGRDEDERQHSVSVASFSLSRFELTVREFAAFVKETGYVTHAEHYTEGRTSCREYDYVAQWKSNRNLNWRNASLLGQRQENANHPVVCVNWRDAQAYIKWLNQVTGKAYRLPTEAELEYVARAGSQGHFEFNEDESKLCEYSNVGDLTKLNGGASWNSVVPCVDGEGFTSEIGKYKPNAFGVYDIRGNVREWTCSAYNKNYNKGLESKCAPENYLSWLAVRGGSYSSGSRTVRAANRLKRKPLLSFANAGFRLASD